MTAETQERARILEPELRARGTEFALWRSTKSWTRDKLPGPRRWHRAGVAIEESVDPSSGRVQWLWATAEQHGSEATALDAMQAAFEAVNGPPMELDLVPWSELLSKLD